MKKKIVILTTTRAEYYIQKNLFKKINSDKNFDLNIIVSGTHLSPEFGYTFKEIENDGFKIKKKIEIILSSDSPVSICKSMGLAQISYAEALQEINPDILIILGDRYEILPAAISALILKIPIVHLYGGESTEGLIDEAIRNSVTKISNFHFTSTEEYRKKIIQMGENPDRVFNAGSLGVENIINKNFKSKLYLNKKYNFNFNKKNLLITYHPVTLENNSSESQFNEILLALNEIEDTNFIFTKPNSDTYGRIISKMIDEFVNKNKKNSISFISLGEDYLDFLYHVDAVIGNSSSGIIEAPSLNTPTINIGDRQKGRIIAKTVINCSPKKIEILNAIKKVYDPKFKKQISKALNPYYKKGSSDFIVNTIKKLNLKNILKKSFHKINF